MASAGRYTIVNVGNGIVWEAVDDVSSAIIITNCETEIPQYLDFVKIFVGILWFLRNRVNLWRPSYKIHL
jgi:hypothetical protein